MRESSDASSAYSLRARGIDFVEFRRSNSVRRRDRGAAHGAVRWSADFDRDDALGRNAGPVRHRRLRNTELPRQFAHAAGGTNCFLESLSLIATDGLPRGGSFSSEQLKRISVLPRNRSIVSGYGDRFAAPGIVRWAARCHVRGGRGRNSICRQRSRFAPRHFLCCDAKHRAPQCRWRRIVRPFPNVDAFAGIGRYVFPIIS